MIDRAEYKRVLGTGAGCGTSSAKENRASGGTASYYSFAPRKGLRFISIDTVAEGGDSNGNVDHPQYRWLQRGAAQGGPPRRADRRLRPPHARDDERDGAPTSSAGDCDDPGCDEDPRRSTPLHLGLGRNQSVRDLLLKVPNVIAYVAGHTHDNEVNLHKRGRLSFWEIVTASHIDWPQQSRTIELFDNADGTLSLFGTVLDHNAPAAVPPPGPADAFTPAQLASLGRAIAWNDPQRPPKPASGEPNTVRAGTPADRNVELLIRDPRK